MSNIWSKSKSLFWKKSQFCNFSYNSCSQIVLIKKTTWDMAKLNLIKISLPVLVVDKRCQTFQKPLLRLNLKTVKVRKKPDRFFDPSQLFLYYYIYI